MGQLLHWGSDNEFLGGNGFVAMVTGRRDKLPGEIEVHQLHKKTDYFDKMKMERFFNPGIATNITEKVLEKEQVTMGRTLRKLPERRSNVSTCHFSPHHCVTLSL